MSLSELGPVCFKGSHTKKYGNQKNKLSSSVLIYMCK